MLELFPNVYVWPVVDVKLLTDPTEYSAMSKKANLYGDGKASERIVSFLLNHFNK